MTAAFGDFRFAVEPDWAKLREEWDLKDVGGAADMTGSPILRN